MSFLSYLLYMASLHTVEVLWKRVKHGISVQNHFQKRRKKLFGSLSHGLLAYPLMAKEKDQKPMQKWNKILNTTRPGLKALGSCGWRLSVVASRKLSVMFRWQSGSALQWRHFGNVDVFLSWKLLKMHKLLSFQVYWSSADMCCLQRLEQALTLAKTDPHYCLSQSCV